MISNANIHPYRVSVVYNSSESQLLGFSLCVMLGALGSCPSRYIMCIFIWFSLHIGTHKPLREAPLIYIPSLAFVGITVFMTIAEYFATISPIVTVPHHRYWCSERESNPYALAGSGFLVSEESAALPRPLGLRQVRYVYRNSIIRAYCLIERLLRVTKDARNYKVYIEVLEVLRSILLQKLL